MEAKELMNQATEYMRSRNQFAGYIHTPLELRVADIYAKLAIAEAINNVAKSIERRGVKENE